MKSFNNIIREDNVNEFVITSTLVATALVSAAIYELSHSEAKETTFNFFSGLYSNYKNIKNNIKSKREEKRRKREEKEELKREERKREETTEIENQTALLALATKVNNNDDSNSEEKKQNDDLLKLLYTCSYDGDGNEIPFEERDKKLKEILPETQYNLLSQYSEDKFKELSKDEDVKKELEKQYDTITEKDIEKIDETASTEAQKMWDEIRETQKKNEEIKKEIEELKAKLENSGAENKKDIKKQLEDANTKLKNNQPTLIKNISKNYSSSESGEATPEKDEDGNIIKQEEVTDEKTGKKIKVVTHTGPRGGKFYYPEGKPKTAEHKVYVKESKLRDYILSKLI